MSCSRRRSQLEQQLEGENLSEEEKQRQREDFEKREREYTRFQRTRMTAADFEPLTVIGRGAFGEVKPAQQQQQQQQKQQQNKEQA